MDGEVLELFSEREARLYKKWVRQGMVDAGIRFIMDGHAAMSDITEILNSTPDGVLREYQDIYREYGEDRFALLGKRLLEDGRMDDFLEACEDEDYREQLYEEYGIGYPDIE